MSLNGATAVTLVTVAFIAAGAVMVVLDEIAVGVFALAVGVFGLLLVAAMAFADQRGKGFPPPRA